ncbi:flagellar export chaperone FlgN [Budviciaceae bacterium CWB-B4]|uniref:Flagellar export chaperone FlgN n=2 Tax=Limnobaculum xujianqingii TaxID=2738837 RepID=A0A9D7FW66_9GAMM|nr:flagellar export chaperone FlgN [Limnobaculum xujianqingii]MBK5175236.1 flagellar export chaperone FlgN [Limnobaculum xujianqingii]
MKMLQEQIMELLAELQLDRRSYIRLILLLKQQQAMITARKTDAIDEINQRISHIYHQLTQSAQKRISTLKNLCIPPHDEGILFLFSRLPANHHIQAKELWNDIMQRMHECSRLSALNHQILSTRA